MKRSSFTFELMGFITVFLGVFFILGSSVSPFSKQFYTFHDETQAARIIAIADNIKAGIVPPRIAPTWSNYMGYPAFSFYPSGAYIPSTLLYFMGLDVASSLKWGFMIGLLTIFTSSFLLLWYLFGFLPGLFGASITVSSLYIGMDLVARGNLAEIYFMALFPLALFLLLLNAKIKQPIITTLTAITIGLFMYTHTILSPIGFVILLLFIFFLPQVKKNIYTLVAGLLLSSFFWLPFLMQSNYTWAKELTIATNYKDHFLCISQLWKSQDSIGFGGSIPGCSDPITFKLGKAHIIMFVFSLIIFIYASIKRQIKIKLELTHKMNFFFITLFFGSIFLSLNYSAFLWNAFPFTSYIQFPWRFLAFSPLAIGGLASAAFFQLPIMHRWYLVLPIIFALFFMNKPYFFKDNFSVIDYNKEYGSEQYISQYAAYKYPEPLPRTVSVDTWQQYNPTNTNKLTPFNKGDVIDIKEGAARVVKNQPFLKEITLEPQTSLFINIHSYPNWRISLDKNVLTKYKTDVLGRPLITNATNSMKLLTISFVQTPIEILGNAVSILTLVALLFWSYIPYYGYKKH